MNRRTNGAFVVVLVLMLALCLLELRQNNRIQNLEYRVDELNCVHYIHEDGDAVHIDAEVALDCLRRRLGSGWHETEILPVQR